MTVEVIFNAFGDGTISLYAAAGATTPAVGPFKAYFGVTGPRGIIVKPFPSTPDFTFAALGNNTVTIDIPRTSDGEWWEGEYTVRVYITDSTGTPIVAVDETSTLTISLVTVPGNTLSPNVGLAATADCDTGIITVTGIPEPSGVIGEYTVSIDNETVSVTPPASTGESASNEEGRETLFAFGYNGVDYAVRYQYDVTKEWSYSETTTWYIIETVAAETTVTTDCINADLCKAVACVDTEFKILDASVCAFPNGWERLSEEQKGRFNKAASILRMILYYYRCSNQTKINEYSLMLDNLLDCKCGCGPASTAPVPYIAPNPPA